MNVLLSIRQRLTQNMRALQRRGALQWIPVALLLPLSAGASHWWMEHRQTPPGSPGATATQVELQPAPPPLHIITGHFQKNQNITQVLLAEGLSVETVHGIIEAARPLYNLARVQAGKIYELYFTANGEFRDFRYPVDADRYLSVRQESDGAYIPAMENYPFETHVERIEGTITSSLFAAVSDIKEDQSLAIELSDIFGSDIDFNTDDQRGDSFQALVEKKYLDGKFSRNGAILAASFTNAGKTFTGFRFTDENGKPAWYAPDGKALRRAFLKAPLKIIRITSRFSTARMHPVLKIVRPHLGIDYGAPKGTPVQAVGNGTVITAGWSSGGGGNTIKLRHAGGYVTSYMHLSRIRVKNGQRVSQGDIIGNVGATGLATGPHLDFRVYKNGKAINPAKVVFPPGKPVAPDKMAAFSALRDQLTAELRLPEESTRQARK